MLEVRDPADVRSVVAEVPAMTAAEVVAAYARARAAFEVWRRVNPLDRAAVLARAADLIRARVEDGAVTLVRENGKTLAEARVEVTKTADFLDYYASFARQPWGELIADARPGTSTSVRVEPVGVVLAICPWNDPLITPARKLGPALIAGNAVVLKAASQTPGIAIWAAGLLAEAGLPEGVVQVITGRNSEISGALLATPDAVTFTGSNEVGAYLRRVLADRNVRLQAELGGKNVSVVLADADLDMAAATVVSAAFAQAGQRCTATSRLIVAAAVAAPFTARLREKLAEIVVGPGLDPATTMGPLSYAAHRDGVLGHIERARGEGATVIAGGGRPSSDALAHGCYVEPTLISVTPEQSLWRDEVFGPVLAVTTADGFDDAVRLANDTAYGLAAAVFTTSLTSANKFIDLAEAGQVAVNLPTAGWDVHHPFGGFHESGSAFKEQGSPGLRFYTRIKTAAVRFGVVATDSVGIVGAGIVGLAIARKLAAAGVAVTVFEKEAEVARHQTGHNSGVVHAGIYYAPGSAKARMTRRGVGLLKAYCTEKGLVYSELGKLVVARDEGEVVKLRELERRSRINQVPGLMWLEGAELREFEPDVAGVAALLSPSTAIVDYPAIARSFAADVTSAGGQVLLGTPVTGLRVRGGTGPGAGGTGRVREDATVEVETPGRSFTFTKLVICAGLQADLLAVSIGDTRAPEIVPFRGEYLRLTPRAATRVKRMIYPVPDPRYPFLGVHLTPRVDGTADLGPNAVLALAREGYRRTDINLADLARLGKSGAFWRLARRHWMTGVREYRGSFIRRAYLAEARTYLPWITLADVTSAPAGVRAQAVDADGGLVDDFRISQVGPVTSIRNAPSPAATASMAIAEHVIEELRLPLSNEER